MSYPSDGKKVIRDGNQKDYYSLITFLEHVKGNKTFPLEETEEVIKKLKRESWEELNGL